MNATYHGVANTFWSGVLDQTYVDTGSQIIYTSTIVNGQTVKGNGTYSAQAQFNLFGVNQTTSADTYEITTTTVTNVMNTVSGHF